MREIVECRDLEIFGILAMFLGEDGMPFRSGDERIETPSMEDLAIPVPYQGGEIYALRPADRNLVPYTTIRVIGLVDANLA